MTRLCLLSMGRAEGCAETLLLPGWGGRSAWSARAAPVPIPLVPTSIPNRAEGFTPALGQAGTPPSTLLSSSAARRPLSAGTAPTATGSTRVVVASAWAALRGQGCQAEQDRGGRGMGRFGGTAQAPVLLDRHPGGASQGAGAEQAAPGAVRGAGRSGASRLHRSCFLHIFVHECEEFPRPAGAGGSPREVRGSSSCRVSLSRWENHPKDCGDPYHREGSQSWCMSQGTVGPRALSPVPGRAASLPRGTDVSCDLMKMLLASGFI